jgi:uracil-DNA glycosylase family 4
LEVRPECKGCPRYREGIIDVLTGESRLTFVPPTETNEESRVVVWGEMAGSTEASRGQPFLGQAGQVLRRALRKLKVRVQVGNAPMPFGLKEQAVLTNVVLCRAENNVFPRAEIARECLARHQSLPTESSANSSAGGVHSLPWLACGANAVEALTGYRLPILKARGSVLPVLGQDRWLTATYHPAFLVYGPRDEAKGQVHLEPLLSVDARRALDCGGPKVPHVFFGSPDTVISAFRRDQPKAVSVDIEGGGGEPKLVGLAWSSDQAWVMRWSNRTREVTEEILHSALPIAHNASYDVPELREAGIDPPAKWIDTINLATCYNPAFPMNLQFQVLTHVPGSTIWKGLVDHERGPDWEGQTQKLLRGLWREIFRRLGRQPPTDGWGWYAFYNGLDTAWTFGLAEKLRKGLAKQGRYQYYKEVLQPLQQPLLDLGERGIPTDPERFDFHARGCRRLVALASAKVAEEGKKMLMGKAVEAAQNVREYLQHRRIERFQGKKKYSNAEGLSKARGRLRDAKKRLREGFSLESPQQKSQLVGEWLGLPLPRTEKGNLSTKDDGMEVLLKKLSREDEEGKPFPVATVKPKKVSLEKAIEIVGAIVSGTKWAHWEKTFLR